MDSDKRGMNYSIQNWYRDTEKAGSW